MPDGPFFLVMSSVAQSTTLTGPEIDAEVLRLIGSPRLEIPPAPTVALKLQELIGREDFGGPDLVKIIETDGTLTAMVLRYANSAGRAARLPVTELTAAVSRVGIRAVAQIALAQELGRLYGKTGKLADVRKMLWQRSLVSALVCQTLARHRGWNADQAFTVGLLHDFGASVVLAAAEKVLDRTEIQRPVAEWIELAMESHTEVGSIVANDWQLPPLLHDAMVYHHSPGMSEHFRNLLELIDISDRVAMLFERHVEITDQHLLVCLGDLSEVQKILDELPGYARRIELLSQPPSAGGRKAVSAVLGSDHTTLHGPIRTLDLPLEVVGHGGDFSAVGIATDGLVVMGSKELPLNTLTRVTVKTAASEPFELWCNAVLCEPVELAFRIELRPFALNGEVKERFNALFTHAQPA